MTDSSINARRARSLAVALVAAASGWSATAATANEFYVDGAQAGVTHPCTSAAAACKTITDAITDARATGEADLINVAAGTYGETVALNDAADAGDTVSGQGQATIIAAPGTGSSVLLGGNVASGVTLSNLVVHVASSAKTQPVIDVNPGPGGSAALSSVAVSVTNAGHDQTAIHLVQGAITISDSAVRSTGMGAGIDTSGTPGSLMLTDSLVGDGGAATLRPAVELQATETTHIVRSTLQAYDQGADLVSFGGSTTVDSSLILGGQEGVRATGPQTGKVLLRHVTIDPNAYGSTTPGGEDGYAVSADAAANVVVANSIALGGLLVTGGATLACLYSDVALTDATGVACGTAEHNIHQPPAVLFANVPAADYQLRPGSPAVDAGSPGPLPADESSGDVAGTPRVLDGNLDCQARTDMGAYELLGFANAAPTASITAPASAGTFQPVTFSSTTHDEDGPAQLQYAWAFTGGAHATSASTTQHFATVGTKHVVLTVTDTHGCTGKAIASIGIHAVVRPVLTKVGARIKTAKGHSRLTAFKYTLSGPADVSIKWQRCSLFNSQGHCTQVTGQVFRLPTRSGLAGPDAEAVSRLLQRLMHIASDSGGRYRARIQATDPSGVKSLIHTFYFAIH
jgi:hypothetical protein